MKIHFNADGSVKTIEDRGFLVSGSSGVNILEVFSDYPFEDISKVKAYASFQRADGRVLTNIAMQLAPIEEPTHFELELVDDLGILAIPGELQISIKLKFDGKTLANGIVVGNVYRSIRLPDEPDINAYHIHDLQNRVDHLEQEKEDLANKAIDFSVIDDTNYPTTKAVKTELDQKVDKQLTIIGLDLQDDISISEFRTALGNATQSVAGLLSAEDKTQLDELATSFTKVEASETNGNIKLNNEEVVVYDDTAVKQQITDDITTHNTSETSHTDIREAIEEARAIAEGKVSAMSFETKAELDAWLLIPENVETLIVGTNFYIEDLASPDYWWNGTTLVELSTEKIDLTEYAKKTELLTLGTTENDAYRGDLGQIAYNHSQSAHAPSNAQKNSDITKAEIEAKLTGEISSHSHALPNHNHDDRYYTETEVDTKLGGKANATHNHTKSDITDFPTIPTIPNISITNGTAEIGKYISQVAVDATDKHKLIVTKADLPQGFSGNYEDLTNKPIIPTVPTISTSITTDATSDAKTASPKAVKTYVDNAISTALDNLLGGEY